MQLIYYPKCSTCLKAIKHLKSLDYHIELRNIVENTPTKEELLDMIHQYQQGIKPFLNTSGKVYRELHMKDRILEMSEEEIAELMSQNGMLIKRPILIDDHQIIIGYKEEIYNALL